MERETAQIWLPPTHSYAGVREARQAARDYDPNLDFGFNEKTQQWCVFLKVGTMDASKYGDLPILGFKGIPGRDEVMKRLYQTDALRRGQEILDEWNRQNDLLTNKDHSNADGQLAEAVEWGFRKMGSDKAPTKVYMNEGKK